jgi:hypothetical protein
VDFNDAAADAGYQTPVVYKFWAMTFFQAPPEMHMSIAKHLTCGGEERGVRAREGRFCEMDLPAAAELLLRCVVLRLGRWVVLRGAFNR